ncbi:MAG: serine/threonine protein kinase [Archangium sp.]|nr:serine/threonine protein kinase [Archangium sp.]
MACAHTNAEHCSICAATLEAPLSELGQTFVRGESGKFDADSLSAGASIGRYVVLERLGQGGMGVVYTARDPQLERVVAIKVLRASVASGKASTSGQARLLREAQAMAQVAHPNVVPVYDSGPFGRGIFIAMELVKGGTLDLWLKLKPRAWTEVLRVFIEAGRGLQAAHAKGLIHRDFKPANVLLGDDLRPRVTDFGLARATKSSSSTSSGELDSVSDVSTSSGPISLEQPLTQAGAMMGSPGYMAPEQYDGADTSEATDQFSFCVSLYEALYGARPFPGKSLSELAASTRAGIVPPAPKGSEVPAWVHSILVKGLSVEPSKRHRSLSVLLAALSDDPTLRRRRAMWLGAAGLALVCAFGAFGWWNVSNRSRTCQGNDALVAAVWNDAVKQRSEAAFLATKVPYAKASWALTKDALDVWARDWTEARTEACLATKVRGEQTERQLLLRFECLDRRLTELSTLADQFAQADQSLVSGSGTAAAKLSSIASCSNVKQLEDRRAPPPELAKEAQGLAEQISRGRALVAAGRIEGAHAELNSAAARTMDLKLVALEADARESLAALLVLERKFVDARKQYELAVRAAEIAGDDATAARVVSQMVSVVGWRLGRPDEARTWAALASGIVQRIGGDVLIEAHIEEGLGDAEWQDGNRAKSLQAYRQALQLYVKAQGEQSLDVARLRSSAGWVLTEQGELAAARKEIEASRVLREQLLGPDHPTLADTWNDLAGLAAEQRDYVEAVRCERMSVQLSGVLVSRRLAAETSLASMLILVGQPAEGLALADALRAQIDVDQTPASWIEYGRARVHALTRLGRLKEAWSEGKTTLTEQERKLGKLHPEVAAFAEVLGETAFALGNWQEAVELSERYLAMKATLGGADSPKTGETLLRSAQAHLALGRGIEAAPRAERALIAIEKGKPDRKLRAEARRVLAAALLKTAENPQRAAALLQEAKEEALAEGDQALVERIEKTK